MKKAFIFPGQGSQFIGMGRELAFNFVAAKRVFKEVDEALNIKLSRIIFYGTEEELTLTENAQPALMAVSMALIRVMEKEFGINMQKYASFFAGHSLGEFTALAASGAIKIADAAKLLRIRGKAMQIAAPVGSGLMAALIGCDKSEVEAIIEEALQASENENDAEICQIANLNCPGQIVISGHVNVIKNAIKIASEKSKKAVALSVSAPFHSKLMESAKGPLAEALNGIQISKPCAPIVANVSALPINEVQDIKRSLIEQVSANVRWQESVEFMISQGVKEFVSVGPGTVLAGLNRRINRDVKTHSLQQAEDIEIFAKNCLETV